LSFSIDLLQKLPGFSLVGQPVQLNSRRAEAMLFYLGLSSETVHSRESLACLFWQEADASHSRGSLRQLLRRIKQKCPALDGVFRAEREQIVVNHSEIVLDVDMVLKGLDSAGAEAEFLIPPLELDEFLADCRGLSNALDSWISITRNRIETELCDALMAKLDAPTVPLRQRIQSAQALLNLDPVHEPSCRFLMRAYAEEGNQSAALRVYNDLYQYLADEFDVEPSGETIDLVAKIKMGEIGLAKSIAPAAAEPLLADTTPEIFVCPFLFGTESGRLADLERVFRYELFANLTSFREWRIFDIEPARRQCYRLEGIFSEVGNEVILIATLKQEADNRVIWSERFQIDFENWQRVQHRIAQQLCIAVNNGVSSNWLNKCLSNGLNDRSVFDKWLLAQSLLQEWRPGKTDAALKLLTEITADAPQFAPAHSWLSSTENIRHIMYPGVLRNQELLEDSLRHARLAIEIDPLDSRAHLAAAWSCAMNGQFEVSRFHFERTTELNPNSVLTRMSCALGYGFLDDLPRAVDLAEDTRDIARNLPPFLWGYLLNIYYLDGQLEKAVQAGELAGSAISNLPGWMAATLWELGDKDGARVAAREFVRCVTETWCAQEPPDTNAMVDWFVQCFPMRRLAQSDRLRDGITAALRA